MNADLLYRSCLLEFVNKDIKMFNERHEILKSIVNNNISVVLRVSEMFAQSPVICYIRCDEKFNEVNILILKYRNLIQIIYSIY